MLFLYHQNLTVSLVILITGTVVLQTAALGAAGTRATAAGAGTEGRVGLRRFGRGQEERHTRCGCAAHSPLWHRRAMIAPYEFGGHHGASPTRWKLGGHGAAPTMVARP
jgi:hypothetical protein